MKPSASPLVWEYGQPWRPETEPAFAPGFVSLGRWKDELLVRAELWDAHVMMDAFPMNYPAYTQCDAFELFLGPSAETAYYELHVTPSNSVLQLRFDSAEARNALENHRVATPLFFSETSITPRGWNVFARIPLHSLFSEHYSEWRLSFGRYDYTPGQSKPVISSTSPHTVCNFHRTEEWRRVSFEGLPLLAPE